LRKDFIVSKIEASQDGSPYVYISITDPNDKVFGRRSGKKLSSKPLFGLGIGAVPFTSPEDLMKNLPEAMSNMLEGRGMGMPYDIPIFKINMKEYEDMQLKVGEKVTIVIKKTDDSSTGI
jgi:hypothetical protein